MKTTLKKIKENDLCQPGWEKLLKALGKTTADNEAVELSFILDSNGYEDALWALRAVEGYDREIRLFAVWCARQVQHLMTDERSINALDVAERFANGEATIEELNAAGDAALYASAAARAAPLDDSAAAWYAASAAAWHAASDPASDAASDAACAASDAAWAAARATGDAQIEEFKKLIAL